MPALPSPANARPATWAAMGLLVAAVVMAYGNSLRGPFVYDDPLAIVENPSIRSLWPLTKVLLPLEGGSTASGRPVLNLSLALSYALSGNAPWGYHGFNLLVHASAALLLFGLVRRTLCRREGRVARHQDGVGLAVAGLWALHPLQTQAITYTVQRAESLMGFFYLLTLYAFVRAVDSHRAGDQHERRRRSRWMTLSVVACLLGIGTKEVMATAPLMVLLYDRTFVAGTFASAWRERRGYYLAMAATWLVLAALVISTGGNRGGTVGFGVGVPFWAYPLTQFQAVARYCGLALWPAPLVFEYGTFWVQRAGDILPYAAVVLPMLALTIVALRRWPATGFLGAWFFAILAPSSLAPGTIQMIVEHRMYLPLAAVATLVVLALRAVAGRRAIVGAIVVAASCGVLTARRNHDYRSHLALWTDTVAKRPLNPRAHEGLAEALTAAGRHDEAIRHREESIRLLPDESTYHFNLALTLAEAGRTADAVRHYQLSLRLVPGEAKTHNNLAILQTRLGDHAAALQHYEEAARLNPAVALYHYNLGVALMRANRAADAAASYEIALRLDPDRADAHFNLGAALVRLGRIEAALGHYTTAVQLKPGEADYRLGHGGALLLAGRSAEALAEFRRVLAADANSVEAMFGAGNALAALRRPEEAITNFEALLRRAPDHGNGHFKLGNALLDLDRVPAAAGHYETAIRIRPEDAEAHHNLGVAYARMERWPDAQREFETALRLKPDYADARRSLELLRRAIGR